MFRFLCKKLIQNGTRTTSSSNNNHVYFSYLQTQSLKSKSEISIQQQQPAFTVSYLINSCGFPLEDAISASKKICIKTTERPDSVLELLTRHGFTKTHITKLFIKDPLLLTANPEILKPKFEYFESFGISSQDLAKILSSDRGIFRSSLSDRIIPNFDFLRKHVHTNENLIATFKQSSRIATCSLKVMEINISTLKAHGVPESSITKLILSQPITLMQNTERFSWVAGVIKEMGFVHTSRIFVFAIHTMLGLSQSNWERKIEIFKSFGWSKDDTLAAFRLQPNCMLTSEEKINKLMDFYENKIGLKPSCIARYPNLLLYSLEKRIAPRCSVLQFLKSKGLVKENGMRPSTFLHLSKSKFESRFVTRYQEIAPEVVDVYNGKITLPELNIGLEDDVIQVDVYNGEITLPELNIGLEDDAIQVKEL